MTSSELRALFDETLDGDRPHVEQLTVAAAIISEVLRRNGMQATLIGGGAIEFHASDVYSTSDIDLIVEGKSREELDATLTAFGFAKRGRHWVYGDLFVEVPGNWMSDPVDVVAVGALTLRVIRREIVLADRIIGFKHWRATAYGAQAVALLALFGRSLDERLLLERIRAEGAEDALNALRNIADGTAPVTEEYLRALLERLHSRPESDTGGSKE